MLPSLFKLVVGTVADLLALAFLARFAMQWARASFRNPVGRFVLAVTDWAVLPARKVVPGLFGLDLSTLVLAWLVQTIFIILLGLVGGLHGGLVPAAFGVALLVGLVETIRLAIHLAIGLVIVAALLSWINPHALLAPLFHQLSAPLLRPAQRIIPPIGGVDLSPLLVLLVLQALLMVLGYASASLLGFAP